MFFHVFLAHTLLFVTSSREHSPKWRACAPALAPSSCHYFLRMILSLCFSSSQTPHFSVSQPISFVSLVAVFLFLLNLNASLSLSVSLTPTMLSLSLSGSVAQHPRPGSVREPRPPEQSLADRQGAAVGGTHKAGAEKKRKRHSEFEV